MSGSVQNKLLPRSWEPAYTLPISGYTHPSSRPLSCETPASTPASASSYTSVSSPFASSITSISSRARTQSESSWRERQNDQATLEHCETDPSGRVMTTKEEGHETVHPWMSSVPPEPYWQRVSSQLSKPSLVSTPTLYSTSAPKASLPPVTIPHEVHVSTDEEESPASGSPIQLEGDALIHQDLHPDGQPRRPMNAFMIFARHRRPDIQKKESGLKTGEISKRLSAEWKVMAEDKKQFYLDQAKKLKDQFHERYPDYVYRRRPNNQGKRRGSKSKTAAADDPPATTDLEDDAPGSAIEPQPASPDPETGVAVSQQLEPQQSQGTTSTSLGSGESLGLPAEHESPPHQPYHQTQFSTSSQQHPYPSSHTSSSSSQYFTNAAPQSISPSQYSRGTSYSTTPSFPSQYGHSTPGVHSQSRMPYQIQTSWSNARQTSNTTPSFHPQFSSGSGVYSTATSFDRTRASPTTPASPATHSYPTFHYPNQQQSSHTYPTYHGYTMGSQRYQYPVQPTNDSYQYSPLPPAVPGQHPSYGLSPHTSSSSYGSYGSDNRTPFEPAREDL